MIRNNKGTSHWWSYCQRRDPFKFTNCKHYSIFSSTQRSWINLLLFSVNINCILWFLLTLGSNVPPRLLCFRPSPNCVRWYSHFPTCHLWFLLLDCSATKELKACCLKACRSISAFSRATSPSVHFVQTWEVSIWSSSTATWRRAEILEAHWSYRQIILYLILYINNILN